MVLTIMNLVSTQPVESVSANHGVRVVTASTMRELLDDLSSVFAGQRKDPFEIDLIVAPGSAHQRAVSQRLAVAHRSGICAGVEFTTLGGLRRRLDEKFLPQDGAVEAWSNAGLTLRLVELISSHVDEPWAEPLKTHLKTPEQRPGRLVSVARRVARLFRRYLDLNPAMIDAWKQGNAVSATGTALSSLNRWQYELFALLRDENLADPTERHQALVSSIASQAGWQSRFTTGKVGVLNVAGLLPDDVEMLAALNQIQPVELWQLDHRFDSATTFGRWSQTNTAAFEHLEGLESTALSSNLVASPSLPMVSLEPCHGPERQVEVAREILCGLFEDDPTLEPRDVAIVCPNLERYAPLLEASFGLAAEHSRHPGHQLRVQVAADSRANTNLVMDLLDTLLNLSTARATSADLLELCTTLPVAHRFGLNDDESQLRLRRLIAKSDVRWGVDGGHRARAGMPQVGQSTWLQGVERLIAGIAFADEPDTFLGNVSPVPRLDSQDAEVIGQLAEIVSRVRKTLLEFSTPTTAALWVERLRQTLELLVALPFDDQWQLSATMAQLAELHDSSAHSSALITAADMARILQDNSTAMVARPNWGKGNLMAANLSDVQGLEHKVLVVLGLEDADFPVKQRVLGDNLLADQATPIAHDRRAASLQQLLDAVLSTSQRVVVTYQAKDARSNEPLDKPVAVTELVNGLRECGGQVNDSQPGHPLQPTDAINFQAADDEEPFSFDVTALAGVQALAGSLASPPSPANPAAWVFNPKPVPPELELGELLRFFRHPARELLRHQIGITLGDYADDLKLELPLPYDGLAEYEAGKRLLESFIRGDDRDDAVTAERLRGAVPPGALGRASLDRLRDRAETVAQEAQTQLVDPREFAIDHQVGRHRLVGSVRVHGTSLVSYDYAKLNGHHVISAWLTLLTAVAAGHPVTSASIIRQQGTMTLGAPKKPTAQKLLTTWVELRETGLTQIVPLPMRTLWEFKKPPSGAYKSAVRDAWQRERDEDWTPFTPENWTQLIKQPTPIAQVDVATLADQLLNPVIAAKQGA